MVSAFKAAGIQDSSVLPHFFPQARFSQRQHYRVLVHVKTDIVALILAYAATAYDIGYAIPMLVGTIGAALSFAIAIALGTETRGKELVADVVVANSDRTPGNGRRRLIIEVEGAVACGPAAVGTPVRLAPTRRRTFYELPLIRQATDVIMHGKTEASG